MESKCENNNKEWEEVAVTGGAGFIASCLISQLLQRGYKVRTTVRDPSDSKKIGFLQNFENSQNLSVHQAELLDNEEKFYKIFEGCKGLFHTASPVFFETENPEEELIQPAVIGTRTIINAALNASIKRIIFTSSVATIFGKANQLLYNEEVWSEEEELREQKQWYSLSKLLAEKEAFKVVETYNQSHPSEPARLVVIIPSFVTGPLLQPTLNYSSSFILDFLTGKKKEIPNFSVWMTDVRDISNAHILCLENENACGRYLCAAENVYFPHLCDSLTSLAEKLLPAPPLISNKVQDTPPFPPFNADLSKLKSLGWVPLPFQQTLSDTVTSLLPHYLTAISKPEE